LEGSGIIRDKLDIKILILFILRRLPEAAAADTLAELALRDVGIGYFDYAECLGELVDTGHAEALGGAFRITEKGARNGEILESSLPYSVRAKAERVLAPVAAAMRRSAMIRTSHSLDKDGCHVELSMSDGLGDIIGLRVLCAGEEQASLIERRFQADAEKFYNRIISMLLEEEV
jgi:predicted transcriptional regulator